MKLKLAFILTLIAIGIHTYLAIHFYSLSLGINPGDSICNINSTFNCDTVTASTFSSFLGIPIAIWGGVANFILAILLMGWGLGWTADTKRIGTYTLWVSGGIALASISMAIISFSFVGAYCLFCMSLYAISFINFALILSNQEKGKAPWKEYFFQLFKEARFYWVYILSIPLLAFFIHKTYMAKIGADDITSIVQTSISEWAANPQVDLNVPPTLKVGPDNAKMKLAEFADFRCSHCKHASPTLHAFINSHKDVQMLYYTFPLDGTCNPSIPGGGDGISCFLAKNVYCAETTAHKGWLLHDYFFSRQEDINSHSSIEYTKNETEQGYTQFNLNADEMKACIEKPETDSAIRAQAKLGGDSGVRGTPAIYVNGKTLPRGQILLVLEAVYKQITK